MATTSFSRDETIILIKVIEDRIETISTSMRVEITDEITIELVLNKKILKKLRFLLV